MLQMLFIKAKGGYATLGRGVSREMIPICFSHFFIPGQGLPAG
jgi:hypothetical protein